MLRLSSIMLATTLVSFFASAKTQQPTSRIKSTTTTTSSSSSSWSSDGTWEVQSHLTDGSMNTSKQGKDTVTTIAAGASIAKVVHENIQAGGEVSFFNSNGGAKNRSFIQVAGFGTYNFQPTLQESFYAKAGLGLFNEINDKGEDESKFGFFAGGGKRIPVMGIVNYVPEARLAKIGSQDPTFSIYFINFSVIF